MSKLTTKQQLLVLAGLVDGNSERGVERMTADAGEGVTKKTIGRFALRLGTAAWHLHNAMARDLAPPMLELDEIWSYIRKKQSRVTDAEHAAGLGEAYNFVGLAMPARYAVTWHVGKRDQEHTDLFAADLRARIIVEPMLMTSDGFAPYVSAIERTFGRSVNYAQVIKDYSSRGRRDDDHRYEPPRDPFITKRSVFGAPDLDKATTSHVERNNGTMRHFVGRMRRLCYAFSKSPEHHRAAVNLAYMYYNLCWAPRTTRNAMYPVDKGSTPAMAMRVAKHPWELGELLDALLSVPETAPPVVVPLASRKPETTSRELPNGRGFLRVVKGGASPSGPSPAPATPPAAPAVPIQAAADAAGQLDLLSWRPRPPEPPRAPAKRIPWGQLDLFGLDLDPRFTPRDPDDGGGNKVG